MGSFATAALAAVQGGLPALGPAIQEAFGLSLVEVTAVFTAFAIGTVVTLLAWGVLVRPRRRAMVIAVGLVAGALAMVGAARADGYVALLAWMTLAGMLGSSAIAASGRAVFGWFPRARARACARPAADGGAGGRCAGLLHPAAARGRAGRGRRAVRARRA